MIIKKVIFVDTKQDAINYKLLCEHRAEAISSDALFIAMSLDSYTYLKERGFAVHQTSNYFNQKSHESAAEKSKEIATWLRERFDFTDSVVPVKLAYNDMFIFWTRFSVHRCLWMIEIITNCVDVYDPKILAAPFSGNTPTESLFLESEENSLGRIVKLVATKKNLIFDDFGKINKAQLFNIKQFIERFKKISIFAIICARFQLWEIYHLLKNIKNKDRPVFFTTRFYNLEKIYYRLSSIFPSKRFYFLPGPFIAPWRMPKIIIYAFFRDRGHQAQKLSKIFSNILSAMNSQKDIFSYYGIDFTEIVSTKIKNNISAYVMNLALWAGRLNGFIGKIDPSAIISNGNRSDDVALAEICENKGITDVLISHGSHVFPKNSAETAEWGEHGRLLVRAPFSHIALQTPCAEKYFNIFPTKSSLLKTGPLIWGMENERIKNAATFKDIFKTKYELGEKKIIVHAGTPKPPKSLRFFVYETPDEYINALCDLAGAVERISDAILIIKFRPSAEISVSDLKALVPFSEKVILDMDHPFLDVLGISQLLVSFSSTTIEEALQNKIPVLLYGGQGRYQHLSGFVLKEGAAVPKTAIYHAGRADILEYGISNILSLNIDGQNSDANLFNEYIYSKDMREPIERLFYEK